MNDQHAKDICKIGQGPECCSFLMMGAGGWQCAKDDPFMESQIIMRRPTMKAKGDNCPGFVISALVTPASEGEE